MEAIGQLTSNAALVVLFALAVFSTVIYFVTREK